MIFSSAQLIDNNFYKEIDERCSTFLIEDEFNNAYNLAKDLEKSINNAKDFKEKYPDLYNNYLKMIIKMKWIGIQIMTEEMIVNMFRNHFTKIFDIPDFTFESLWRKLKIVLLVILDFSVRDEFKKNIRDALLSNSERLTNKSLMINNQEKNSTVGNWILDYQSILGGGKIDNLKRTQYLINGENIKNLNEEEKKKVKFLFDLFERLKLSSMTPEGLEEEIPYEENGVKGIIKGGIFEPINIVNEIKSTDEKQNYNKNNIYINQSNIKARTVSGPPKTPEEKRIDALKQAQENYAKTDLERMVIEEEIEEEKKIEDFKIMANKFPVGSLERRAIEEEIKKLSQ